VKNHIGLVNVLRDLLKYKVCYCIVLWTVGHLQGWYR